MTMSATARRAGTVSAATVALVLSGGGLAFAGALPSGDLIGTVVDTTTSTVASTTGTVDSTTGTVVTTVENVVPLPTPLPTLSTAPLPLPVPTGGTGEVPLPLPTGGTGEVPLPGGDTDPVDNPKPGGVTNPAPATNGKSGRPSSDRPTANEELAGRIGGTWTPMRGLRPDFDLLRLPTGISAPVDAGNLPLVAGPQEVYLATGSAPQLASPGDTSLPGGPGRAAGLAVVVAVVLIGGVAAGHANLLQQRLGRAAH